MGEDQRVVEFKCQACGCQRKGYQTLHRVCPVCGQGDNDILRTVWDPDLDPKSAKPTITR